MTENIKYKSENIEDYYKENRIRWADFYPSERIVFEKLGLDHGSSVLDIGCGCAGLGLALRERFGVTNYTGIEINEKAAETAKVLYPESTVIANDIMDKSSHVYSNKYDVVISLGAIDWNVRFREMLHQAYRLIKPGGYFLCSYRISSAETQNDIKTSYQFVDFTGKQEGELAPYIITNAKELIQLLKGVKPSKIVGYGYYGKPSSTAVTPYEQVCFAVIALKKSEQSFDQPLIDLDLPQDILSTL